MQESETATIPTGLAFKASAWSECEQAPLSITSKWRRIKAITFLTSIASSNTTNGVTSGDRSHTILSDVALSAIRFSQLEK